MPNIVVVDDDSGIREMLEGVLRTQGHQVSTAFDGDDGLETIRRLHPDLVFLDLMMPRMDGFQVLDALKSDPVLDAIPVIIITALDERDKIVQGLEKGANDYMVKPFNMQELVARANVQFRIQELERRLRQSEEYHRALFERASDPELVLDRSGTVVQANSAAMETLDMDASALVGTPLARLISEEERPDFQIALAGAFEGSEIPIFEVHITPGESRLIPVDVDLCLVDIRGERRTLLHLRDIRRRKAAETRSTMIFEYIGDGILITDQNGIILLASRSAAQLTGRSREELVGLDIAQFHSQGGADGWKQATERNDSEHSIYEDMLQLGNDRQLPVEWTTASFTVGSETYYIGVARDLTDRKAADERRMETERLQTLLEISGGAAHEINQPLTAILGYSEMAMDALDKEHQAYSYQKHIADASVRISNILKRMQAIREYRTRPYANGHQIVDFERSSQEEEGATPAGE